MQPSINYVISKTPFFDIESLLFSIISIIISRVLSHITVDPIIYTFSIMLSSVPLFVISLKFVIFLDKKNAFIKNNKSVKLSLLGLFVVPIVYIPITLFNYLSHSYVFYTFILILVSTAFGEKIYLSKKLSIYLKPLKQDLLDFKKGYLIYLQVIIICSISIYLVNLHSVVAPIEMDYYHILMLFMMLLITTYLIITKSTLCEFSLILTSMFIFLFLAIQGIAYYGGDTGLTVSITKYLLNGNEANIISPSEEWRFGSATMLGFPSFASFLSEASLVSPEIALPYANAVSIIFIFIGGYVFKNLNAIGNRNIILVIYILAQSSMYFFVLNSMRPASFLMLLLPLTIPLFTQLLFTNIFGRLCFILSMLSIGVIHPLSYFNIVIMIIYLLYKTPLNRERIIIISIISAIMVTILSLPKGLRALSIHPSGQYVPFFTFTDKIHNLFFSSFVPFSSYMWSEWFSLKFDLLFTLITLIVLLFIDLHKNIPRFALLGYLGLFFIVSSVIGAELFPVERLTAFITTIGLIIITETIIYHFQNYKPRFKFDKNIQKIVSIFLISVIIMFILVNSYPKEKSLWWDTLNVREYALLKDFVNKEKYNFKDSLIFGYNENLRYISGLEGSILYHNATKPFNFDFTDPTFNSDFFTAYLDLLQGNSDLADQLASETNAKYLYLIIIYRQAPGHLDYKNYDYGSLVVQNDEGMIRKISVQ